MGKRHIVTISQCDFHAVRSAYSFRKDFLREGQTVFRIFHNLRKVGEPQTLDTGFLRHMCSLGKGAVAVFFCLGGQLVVPVSGFADQEIRTGSSFNQCVAGSGIPGENDVKSFPVRPQNLLRKNDGSVFQRHRVAALQEAPAFLGYAVFCGSGGIKFSRSAKGEPITLTFYPVACRNRNEHGIRTPVGDEIGKRYSILRKVE